MSGGDDEVLVPDDTAADVVIEAAGADLQGADVGVVTVLGVLAPHDALAYLPCADGGHCKASQGEARQGKARQGKARQGEARQVRSSQGEARQVRSSQGEASQGKASQVKSSQKIEDRDDCRRSKERNQTTQRG